VDSVIEEKLEGREIETVRPEKGIPDQEVMQYAISEGVPVLIRDQGDYIELDVQIDHPGILIDKQMHLRDKSLVAETISSILQQYEEELQDSVIFVSSFYGRF